MKVVRLTISNFRGIKSAELLFDGHTLMVGTNNVGKSTLCEALDLVLGPDIPIIKDFVVVGLRSAHHGQRQKRQNDPI